MERAARLFTRHGLKINLEKTEVLHISHRRDELAIKLEGKKLTQGDSFAYLVGTVCDRGTGEEQTTVDRTHRKDGG